MLIFRLWLAIIFLSISVYTLVTVGNEGLNLFPVFFGDMAKLGWAGQFNLDFMTMLSLSGLWVLWRHEFTPIGAVLGLLAFFGGGLFLSVYLIILSFQTNGNVNAMVLGESRLAAL
tara:strand:- start:7809 stop:8156 length:348 start_codon:yes stop_codon:yes gene_type:complete